MPTDIWARVRSWGVHPSRSIAQVVPNIHKTFCTRSGIQAWTRDRQLVIGLFKYSIRHRPDLGRCDRWRHSRISVGGLLASDKHPCSSAEQNEHRHLDEELLDGLLGRCRSCLRTKRSRTIALLSQALKLSGLRGRTCRNSRSRISRLPDRVRSEVPVEIVMIHTRRTVTVKNLIEFIRARIALFDVPNEVCCDQLPERSTATFHKESSRVRLNSTSNVS